MKFGTPLDGALNWVERGFYCAPVTPGRKAPPLVSDWENAATNDADKIKEWALEHPNCNWLCAVARSGYSVLDLDVKRGKDGIAELKKLGAAYGFDFFATSTVRTPSGGLHLYFRGALPSSAGKLGPGIDVRGRGGYVLVPGSVLHD